jgi:hypothetical protein
VGLKRKGSEKRVEWRAMEEVDEELIALLELSDGVMEQVEAMAKDCLGYLEMNQGIYNTDWLKIGFILS